MTEANPMSSYIQLLRLLSAISPDMTLLVASGGMTVAVDEAVRRLSTERQETRKHLAEVEAQRDDARQDRDELRTACLDAMEAGAAFREQRDAAIDLAAGLIGYVDEYHVAKWGYDKELQRLQDAAKGAP